MEPQYKFSGPTNDDVGLFNNGFEIRGCWNGNSIPLQEFLAKVKRQKDALEYLSRQANIHPDDLGVIVAALRT